MLWCDISEAVDIDDRIDPAEATDPIDANDANDAALPIESTESCEQIDRIEFSDHSDHMPGTLAIAQAPLRVRVAEVGPAYRGGTEGSSSVVNQDCVVLGEARREAQQTG